MPKEHESIMNVVSSFELRVHTSFMSKASLLLNAITYFLCNAFVICHRLKVNWFYSSIIVHNVKNENNDKH